MRVTRAGSTSTEEDFARSATQARRTETQAEAYRRRRSSLPRPWPSRQSPLASGAAQSSEALRAEASKLLALGQVELERNPTAALAYAIKSLELADTEEARRFALRSARERTDSEPVPDANRKETDASIGIQPRRRMARRVGG